MPACTHTKVDRQPTRCRSQAARVDAELKSSQRRRVIKLKTVQSRCTAALLQSQSRPKADLGTWLSRPKVNTKPPKTSYVLSLLVHDSIPGRLPPGETTPATRL